MGRLQLKEAEKQRQLEEENQRKALKAQQDEARRKRAEEEKRFEEEKVSFFSKLRSFHIRVHLFLSNFYFLAKIRGRKT